MKVPAHYRQRCQELERYVARDPGVVHVGIGFKWKAGERTDRLALIVGVKKKGVEAAVVLVPQTIGGLETDVIEYGELEALAGDLPPAALGVRDRARPIPGGYSIGHYLITAGTLGTWLWHGGDRVALTNNHVAANSNAAALGDAVLQPGPYDGGRRPLDASLELAAFAKIHFGDIPPEPPDPPDPPDPPGPPPKKKAGLATFAWKLATGIPNAVAAAVDCPFRAVVINTEARVRRRLRPLELGQPWPNVVDAAICLPVLGHNAAPPLNFIDGIGEVVGLVDLEIGARVQKSGRTTGHTFGMVESIGSARVSYGAEGVAVFQDQLIIRGEGSNFSAGGDSGSAIVDANNGLGGLLFAGGGGVTIANRIAHVVAVLGVTL